MKVTFRPTRFRIGISLGFGLFAVILISQLAAVSNTAVFWMYTVTLSACLAIIYRGIRVAISADEDVVVVRSLLSTRKIPLTHISHFELAPAGVGLYTLPVLSAVLRDGSVRLFKDFSSPKPGGSAEAAELKNAIDRLNHEVQSRNSGYDAV